jgi:hypothetical protein
MAAPLRIFVQVAVGGASGRGIGSRGLRKRRHPDPHQVDGAQDRKYGQHGRSLGDDGRDTGRNDDRDSGVAER